MTAMPLNALQTGQCHFKFAADQLKEKYFLYYTKTPAVSINET